MAEVRVLVVGDDPLARTGLAALLAERDGVSLAAQSTPGQELAAVIAGSAPDVIVWDVGPVGARIERDGDALMAEAGGRVPILAILADDAQAADAIQAGARGLVFRGVGGDRLAAAVRAVAAGLTVIDDGLNESLLRPAATPAPAESLVEPLTPREMEVLQLLAEGLSNKQIARRLAISDHTAKFHVNAILGKLGVQSRTEAIGQAARLGLVIF